MVKLEKLGRSLVRFLGVKLGVILYDLQGVIARRTLPGFANEPKDLFIDFPRRFINPERIRIGNHVELGPGTFLAAITQYPRFSIRNQKEAPPFQKFEPWINIGNRVTATGDLQIAAAKEVVIEDDVMFASNIHINDSLHGYDNADQPYRYQPLTRIAPIHIRYGCWIGQNTIILPGVTIGELTIIGANSLVNCDIPARCIAFGSPARIVKRWNEKKQRWDSVDSPSPEGTKK
jgi:acetyltransferase-like isoleucine patch superfamily enzyme